MLRRRALGLAALAAALVTLTACGAGAAGKQPRDAETLPAGSVAAFYGDSLTFGWGASSPELRWSSLLCARRGWTEVNPSVSGLGFVQARGDLDLPSQIVEAEPDVVLVTLGINDLWHVDWRAADIEAAIQNDLDRLRTGLPDARIVVFSLLSPTAIEPPQVAMMNGWLRDAAVRVDAAFVAKSSGWLVGRPEWTVDGIHLGDVGNAAIAELVDAELRRVLRLAPTG